MRERERRSFGKKGKKREGKKESKKEKEEERKEKKGKGLVVGDGRRSPAAAGGGRNPVVQAQVQEIMGCKSSSFCENGVLQKELRRAKL